MIIKHTFIIVLLTVSMTVFPLAGHGEESGFRFERNRRSVVIPIQVQNNLAVIPIYINNRGPFHFILDSGVNTTILTEPILSNYLDLHFGESILVYGLGGEGIVEAAKAVNVTFAMRGITAKNMNMLVLPENLLSFSEVFGFPVYGIIGHDFLKNFPVRINYANETIKIYRESDYRVSRRSQTIPIRLINGKPYVESTIIGTNGDTLTTHLLFDLGASQPLYLNKEYIALSEHVINGYLGKGISGNLLGRLGRVERLIIGDTHIKEPIVSYPDGRFLEFHGQMVDWEGIIGGGIIKRYEVLLDYQEEKLILRRGQNHGKPFNTSLSGIEVIARGPDMRKFTVHYIRPGSAGYEAGLLAGDQIIALNMYNYRELSLDTIYDTLTSGTGRRISIMVLRDNQVLRKRFRLREDLR